MKKKQYKRNISLQKKSKEVDKIYNYTLRYKLVSCQAHKYISTFKYIFKWF